MPDPREPQSPGEVLHRAREAGNAARIRPLIPEDWADRDPRLKELDEAMAAAVAEVVRERVAGEIAELREALKRHTHAFTDPKGAVLCGGCLRPAPCPDAALCGEGA